MWIVSNSYGQKMVTITNDDPAATPTTDYQTADSLAHSTIGDARLNAKGYTALTGKAIRVYIRNA